LSDLLKAKQSSRGEVVHVGNAAALSVVSFEVQMGFYCGNQILNKYFRVWDAVLILDF